MWRIITLADFIFQIYTWILIARFLLSWIPNVDYSHPVIQFIYRMTDWLVRPFRGIIPPLGGLDFSPIIMFMVLRLGYSLLRRLIIMIMIW